MTKYDDTFKHAARQSPQNEQFSMTSANQEDNKLLSGNVTRQEEWEWKKKKPNFGIATHEL